MQCLHRNPLSRPDLRFRNRRMEAEFVNDPASSCRRLATLTSIVNICLSIGCTVRAGECRRWQDQEAEAPSRAQVPASWTPRGSAPQMPRPPPPHSLAQVLLQGWKRYLQCACVILEVGAFRTDSGSGCVGPLASALGCPSVPGWRGRVSPNASGTRDRIQPDIVSPPGPPHPSSSSHPQSGLELLARCPPSPASTGLRLWLGHALRLGFLLVLGLHVSIPTPYTYSGPHPSLQALRWAAVCSRAPLLAWAALGQAPLLHQRLLSLPLVLAAALLASPGCTCLEAGAEVLRGGSGWIGSDLAFLLARTGMGAGLESMQLAARARPAQALCVTLHWAALVFGVILPQLVSLSAGVGEGVGCPKGEGVQFLLLFFHEEGGGGARALGRYTGRDWEPSTRGIWLLAAVWPGVV